MDASQKRQVNTNTYGASKKSVVRIANILARWVELIYRVVLNIRILIPTPRIIRIRSLHKLVRTQKSSKLTGIKSLIRIIQYKQGPAPSLFTKYRCHPGGYDQPL